MKDGASLRDINRSRWKAFLTPLVGKGSGGASVVDLHRAMQYDRRSERSDDRGATYAYLRGDHQTPTVTPPIAFRYGVALHALGVTWVTGLTSLYAAGHFAHAIALLGRVAETNERAQSSAFELYAALPLATEVEMSAISDGSTLQFEVESFQAIHGELPVDYAREICAREGALSHAAVEQAWAVIQNRSTATYGIRSDLLRLAHRTVSSSLTPLLARDVAWLILRSWVEQGDAGEKWTPMERLKRRERFLGAYDLWRRVITPNDSYTIARMEHLRGCL